MEFFQLHDSKKPLHLFAWLRANSCHRSHTTKFSRDRLPLHLPRTAHSSSRRRSTGGFGLLGGLVAAPFGFNKNDLAAFVDGRSDCRATRQYAEPPPPGSGCAVGSTSSVHRHCAGGEISFSSYSCSLTPAALWRLRWEPWQDSSFVWWLDTVLCFGLFTFFERQACRATAPAGVCPRLSSQPVGTAAIGSSCSSTLSFLPSIFLAM